MIGPLLPSRAMAGNEMPDCRSIHVMHIIEDIPCPLGSGSWRPGDGTGGRNR
jgi:hypothetical protein